MDDVTAILLNIRQQFILRSGINHGRNIGGQIRRVANHQSIHRAFEHFNQFVVNIGLHVQQTQSRATLPRTLKAAGDDVAHRLFRQCRRVHHHRIQSARLSNQQRIGRGVLCQSLVDALRCR